MSKYCYRVEISGGFSGSAYRYHSFLTNSLDKALEYILSEAECPQHGAMLVTERFTANIEYLENGVLKARSSFLPALTIKEGSNAVTFQSDGFPILNGIVLDDTALQSHLDTIIDMFFEDVEVSIEHSALSLPLPNGSHLEDDDVVEVVNAAGVRHSQKCGELLGDLGEAHKYMAKSS